MGLFYTGNMNYFYSVMNINYFDTNTFFINIYHKIQIRFFQNIFYLIIKENRKNALIIAAIQK